MVTRKGHGLTSVESEPALGGGGGGAPECDSDWADDGGAAEEEESGAEDSDEEALNNKLCTFTITQKEFMNQHWCVHHLHVL